MLLPTTVAVAGDAEPAEGGEKKTPPAETSKAGAVDGDTTNRFGEKGTVALDVTTGPMIYGLSGGGTPTFGIETRKVELDGFSDKNTYFYVNPRVHYFVVHNVSIGGEILFASWFADVDLPLLVHPAKHLAIGLGPQFTFTLSQSQKVGDQTINPSTTSYRWLTAHVIGWF